MIRRETGRDGHEATRDDGAGRGVLVVVLTMLLSQAPVPYVQLEPGPTYDTLGKDDRSTDIIVIDGATTTMSAGQLRFVTVGVVPELTLLEAIRRVDRGDDAVVPRELVYPPDKSKEEIDQRNAEDFANSQSAAETAALTELGYPLQIVGEGGQRRLSGGRRAEAGRRDHLGGRHAGDHRRRAAGRDPGQAGRQHADARNHPGRPAHDRGGHDGAGDDGVPRVGFAPELKSLAPFTVDIPIEGIGGPSAGLMLALGIIDKIKPEDLTGGKIIAGTGTIDELGNVGPIGGVPQKIIGAKGAGATFFLTPKDNCAEAVANARPGLMLVQVDNLDMALTALDTLRAGGTPQLCPGATA